MQAFFEIACNFLNLLELNNLLICGLIVFAFRDMKLKAL